jgi:hypothetical protein
MECRVGPAFYAYSANYLIDIAAGIVVDVEATPAHKTDEVSATKTMIERVETRFDIKPQRLIGATNYGTAEILAWMVNEKQIEPHVSVWDKTQRNDDTLSIGDFQWDAQANEYRCPQGKVLRSQWRPFKNPRTHVTKADTVIYHARQADCASRPMKPAAVRTRRRGRLHAASMNLRGMSLVTLPRPVVTSNLAKIKRRSRCCSLTLNVSSSSSGCGCEDSVAHTMSFYWRRLHKVCDEWRSGLRQ